VGQHQPAVVVDTAAAPVGNVVGEGAVGHRHPAIPQLGVVNMQVDGGAALVGNVVGEGAVGHGHPSVNTDRVDRAATPLGCSVGDGAPVDNVVGEGAVGHRHPEYVGTVQVDGAALLRSGILGEGAVGHQPARVNTRDKQAAAVPGGVAADRAIGQRG